MCFLPPKTFVKADFFERPESCVVYMHVYLRALLLLSRALLARRCFLACHHRSWISGIIWNHWQGGVFVLLCAGTRQTKQGAAHKQQSSIWAQGTFKVFLHHIKHTHSWKHNNQSLEKTGLLRIQCQTPVSRKQITFYQRRATSFTAGRRSQQKTQTQKSLLVFIHSVSVSCFLCSESVNSGNMSLDKHYQ